MIGLGSDKQNKQNKQNKSRTKAEQKQRKRRQKTEQKHSYHLQRCQSERRMIEAVSKNIFVLRMCSLSQWWWMWSWRGRETGPDPQVSHLESTEADPSHFAISNETEVNYRSFFLPRKWAMEISFWCCASRLQVGFEIITMNLFFASKVGRKYV